MNATVIQIARYGMCGSSEMISATIVHGKLASSEPSVPRGCALTSSPHQTVRAPRDIAVAVHHHVPAEIQPRGF